MTSTQQEWSSRPPTRGFDDAAKELVQEAASLGWIGRLGKKGHIVMRAPDGVTTATFMPKVNAPRARKNQRAPIERWKRENPEMTNSIETKPKPSSQVEAVPTASSPFACDVKGCDYSTETARGLRTHKTSVHSPVKTCPDCGRQIIHPGAYASHLKSHAVSTGRQMAGERKPPAKRVPPKRTVGSASKAIERSTPATVIDDHSALETMSNDELRQRIRTGNAATEILMTRLQDAEARISLIRESVNI